MPQRKISQHYAVFKQNLLDFIHTPRFRAIFVFGVCLYLVALFALLRGNAYYLDDWVRSMNRQGFSGFSRYMATFLVEVLNLFDGILDISPLYQLLGICFITLASMAILYALNGGFSFWGVIALAPLGLSPYFLQNISYRFDCATMSFALLCACLPFIFRKNLAVFCAVSVVCLVFSYLSYQAANSVYVVICLFFTFVMIVENLNKKHILAFVLSCAGSFVLASGIYKVIFVRKTDINSYASDKMLSFSEMFGGGGGIYANINTYFHRLLSDMAWSPFIFIFCAPCVFFVLICCFGEFARESKNTKASLLGKSCIFICAILFLGVSLNLSFGAYLVLEKPIFAPRVFNGIGAFVAVLCLFCLRYSQNGKVFKFLGRAFALVLAYQCVLYANAYGNALTKQQEYTMFRANLLINDLIKIKPNPTYTTHLQDRRNPNKWWHKWKKPKLLKDYDTIIFIKGTIGYTPTAQELVRRYAITKALLPIHLGEDFTAPAVLQVYKIPYAIETFSEQSYQECTKKATKSARDSTTDSSAKVLLENPYHRIETYQAKESKNDTPKTCLIVTLKPSE